jgi:isopenicillin N synthase-like dioxygenase
MRYLFLLLSMFGLVFAGGGDGLCGKESTIPVLDLRDYQNEKTRDAFIEQVREASHKVGFFALKNTGVNQQIIDNLYASLERFFAYDKDFKLLVDATSNGTGGQRGYTAIGKESAKGSSEGDLKEYYMIGRELNEEQSKLVGYPGNVWPEFYDFESPATAFYNHLEEYSELVQEIFSLALGQEKGFLKEICTNGDTSCRMIHYPLDKSAKKNAVWAAAHTDINAFTLLPKATCEGLEVCDDKGNWLPVFIKEDAMIVNVGDFIEIFSNGYFRSSLHRVKAPENMDTDRYSCVHFVHPRGDSELYPLDSWIEKTGGKAKFIRATRNEMLWERLADLGYAPDFMLKGLADNKVLERLMTVNRASPEAMDAVYKAGYASDEIKKSLEVQ